MEEGVYSNTETLRTKIKEEEKYFKISLCSIVATQILFGVFLVYGGVFEIVVKIVSTYNDIWEIIFLR